MTRYAYFPGCSAHGSGREYDATTRAVFAALGHELTDIPDWSCCGASSAHAVSEVLALALPGRDLAKAEEMGADVLVPCAACFNRLSRAALVLPAMREHLGQNLPRFRGKARVLHPMRPLSEPESLAQLATERKQALGGLRLVPYYGCLTVRPAEVTGMTGPELENPTPMDRIMEVCGAEIRSWSFKTSCCGAGQALPSPEITERLTLGLVEGALEAGADAIVTGCPLCFVNLETQQLQAARHGRSIQTVPVFYFTELVALCLGLPKTRRTLKRHLIPVAQALAERRVAWQ